MTGLRWQYLRVLMEQLPPIERLDELGSQGWEMVQKGILPGQVTLYEWLFKRAVFEHPAMVPQEQPEDASVPVADVKWEQPPLAGDIPAARDTDVPRQMLDVVAQQERLPEPAGDTPAARNYVNRLRVSEERADTSASPQPPERSKGRWSPEARERARVRQARLDQLERDAQARAARWGEQPTGMGVAHGA